MLMGEHAVLRGRRALVAAVSRRLRVHAQARTDGRLRIHSVLGELEVGLGAIEVRKPFEFVLSAVASRAADLGGGLELRVESDFSDQVGLASSAAVAVATHQAISEIAREPASRDAVFQRSLETIRAVQGMGSGADAAAAVWGGVVLYRAEPREVMPLNADPPLTVLYAGYKTPTRQVVRGVEHRRQAEPLKYARIDQAMEDATAEAHLALREQDWPRLGRAMNAQHSLLVELGVCDDTMARMVELLRAQPGIHGAKISGSGLGDCVIGLGHCNLPPSPYAQIPLTVAQEGVRVEETGCR